MRENRLLPWNDDLDMFVTKDEYKKVALLTWKFRLCGYWISVRKHKKDKPPFYDEYLTYCYKDWRIPVREWDHLEDDHAIIRDTLIKP